MRNLAPALLLLLASCVAAPRGPDPKTAEVIASVDRMYDDLSSRRWDALEAHFLPEATLVFSGENGPKRVTVPQFIEMVRKNVEGKEVFEERMLNSWVRTHEDLAFVWSSFAGRVGTAENFKTWSGVDAFTLVKVDGRWKVSQIAVSKDPDPDKY
jgi:hypothetical protein